MRFRGYVLPIGDLLQEGNAGAPGALSDRERRIIAERRLPDKAVTLEELSVKLGVSKELPRPEASRAGGAQKIR